MKVVIVHGIPGNEERAKDEKTRTYDKHWLPWIKEELKKKGIECKIPLMPEPWDPQYEDWKKEFEKIKIDEKDVLIGHSGGCAFLVRWLGESNMKIKKLILVAPWKISSTDFSEGENEMYDFEINGNIKKNVEEIIIFTSDDEEKDGKESAKIYSGNLNGKLVEFKERGHFTSGDMGTNEFPELLEKILK
jgi:hypothetical protein